MILDSGLLFVPLCIVAYQFKKTPSRVPYQVYHSIKGNSVSLQQVGVLLIY